MKKIIAFTLTAVMLIMPLAFSASANRHFTESAGSVEISEKKTPVLDGVINDDEGWSDRLYIDRTKYETAWATHSDFLWNCEVCFACDDSGFYFAADIRDNFDLHIVNEVESDGSDPEYPAGEWYYPYPDTIRNETVVSTAQTAEIDELNFGFNGDVFMLCLNLSDLYSSHSSENSCFYNVSPMHDGMHICRTGTGERDGDIEGAYASGSLTEEGWRFEAFVPQSEIEKDYDGNIVINENYILNDLIPMKSLIKYADRYFDEDQGAYDTWQVYVTLAKDGEERWRTESGLSITAPEPLFDSTVINDVSRDAWYYYGAKYSLIYGYIKGTGNNKFSPDMMMSRAMLVTVVWRMAGEPECESEMPFDDIPEGMWYEDAVRWAADKEIISGIGNGLFAPDGNVTREQIAKILCNFYLFLSGEEEKASTKSLDDFVDSSDISEWATVSVAWAVDNDILAGTDEGCILPKSDAARADASTMIMRLYWNIGWYLL